MVQFIEYFRLSELVLGLQKYWTHPCNELSYPGAYGKERGPSKRVENWLQLENKWPSCEKFETTYLLVFAVFTPQIRETKLQAFFR